MKIPGGDYLFKVQGIEIEGFDDIGVDVQYPWEDMPRRFHEHRMTVKPFYVDKYPVTNTEFKKFMDAEVVKWAGIIQANHIKPIN